MSTPDREERLRSLFEQHGVRVMAYALRHVGPDAAQDVASEVFVTAWRRIDEVPDDGLPWLLVVARNTVSNTRRGLARRQRLVAQLACLERVSTATPGADDVAVERRITLAALADLSVVEREAVLLIGWDGLSVTQAADVLGCSRRAFELRLHRARTRLRTSIATIGHNDPSPESKPQEATS